MILIRHGANGSYKSACIVWFHIIKALKEGRIVVTNMEGMYPLEHIQKSLGITFPDSAKLVRIGSLTIKKKELWQNWFSWMPLGVVVVIDEVQSIYPGKFKGGLKLRPFSDFEEELPDSLKKLYEQQRSLIKAVDFDEGDTDDTGELRFNEDGSIIRADTLEDSFERHRKYNWDIIFGTPDIKQIASNVRACAEMAYSHRSRDTFIFTIRRPRIFEHSPTTNGTTVKKEQSFSLYVPVAVHLCYKSTQTGHVTKSGEGSNPLKSPVLLLIIGVIICALYFFFTALADVLGDGEISAEPILQTSVNPVNSVMQISDVRSSYSSAAGTESVIKNRGVLARINLLAFAAVGNRSNPNVILPFSSTSIFLTGYAHPSIYIFELSFPPVEGLESVIQLNSDDLAAIGWNTTFIDDGLVELRNNLSNQFIYCTFNHRSIPAINSEKEDNNATDASNEITDLAFTAVKSDD